MTELARRFFFDCKAVNRKTGKKVVFEVPVGMSADGLRRIASNLKLLDPEPIMTASLAQSVYQGSRADIAAVLKRHLPSPDDPQLYLGELMKMHQTIAEIAQKRSGEKQKLDLTLLDNELDSIPASDHWGMAGGCSSTHGWENRKGGH